MGAGRGVSSCLAKSVLIITNIIFFLVGLAFFTAGMLLRFPNNFVQPYINQLVAAVAKIAAQISVDSANSSGAGSFQVELEQFMSSFWVPFICIGLFIMVIAMLGMFGACCTNKCMLALYAVIVFLLIIVQLAVIIIVTTGLLNNQIKEQMKTEVKTKYGGFDRYDPTSLLFNIVMLQFTCCGVDSYADFNSSTSWQRERTINVTYGGITSQQNVTLITPVTCCKMDAPFPNGKPIDEKCAYQPTNSISNWNKGCFQELSSFVGDNYKWPVVGAVIGVLLFELVLALLSIAISKTSSNKGSVDAF